MSSMAAAKDSFSDSALMDVSDSIRVLVLSICSVVVIIGSFVESTG